MTRVVIFRASDRPEVGPWAHQPVAEDAVPPGGQPTVLRTVCGLTGIGRTYEREAPNCAVCQAASGQHPGKRGKQHLRRMAEAAR